MPFDIGNRSSAERHIINSGYARNTGLSATRVVFWIAGFFLCMRRRKLLKGKR
jgi:hypothetical protein